MTPPTFEEIAYHEAGHAVGYHLFGYRIRLVTFSRAPRPGRHVGVNHIEPYRLILPWQYQAAATIAMMGPEAERRYTRHRNPPGRIQLLGGETDFQMACDYLRKAAEGEGAELQDASFVLQLTIDEARTLLRRGSVWRAVEHLYAAMRRARATGRIGGIAVHEIIRGAGVPHGLEILRYGPKDMRAAVRKAQGFGTRTKHGQPRSEGE